jgi:hypothetical protein
MQLMLESASSSLWALGGLGIWIAVLAFPLLLYFVIGALQGKERKGKGPDIQIGEETPTESEDKREAG